MAGQAGPATAVEAGLTELGGRRRAETVLGSPARGAGLAVGWPGAGVAAQGAGLALGPATVCSVAGRAVGDTPPGEIERVPLAPGTVRVAGPHTGVAGGVTGRAVAGVLLEISGATPHTTLTSGQHSPGLTGPAPPGLAPHTVTGAVNTQPGILPGPRGTPADTLRGLPGQEEAGPAARALLTAGAGTFLAGVVAGQTLRPGGGEGGGGTGGDTAPVVALTAALQAVRGCRA